MLIGEIKTKGHCVTRNGTYELSTVCLNLNEHEEVEISFVSECLKRALNAGATFDAKAMDELAERWLKARGLLPKGENRSGTNEALTALAEAESFIGEAYRAIKGKAE